MAVNRIEQPEPAVGAGIVRATGCRWVTASGGSMVTTCTSSRPRRSARPQMAARDSGESFAISEPTLRKRLRDKDLLASVDEKRQTLNDPANDWWFLQRGPAFSARHRSAGSDRGWDRRCRVERCRVQCRVRCREIGQPDMDWPSAINNLGAYVGNVGYLQYEGGRENLNRSGLRGRT
jgi:hypothetical protein